MDYYTQNSFGRVDTILAASVADDATFTVPYPTGTSLVDYNAGGVTEGASYMIVNDNDKWLEGASGFTVSYGASEITVTNTTGAALAAGSRISFNFELDNSNDSIVLTLPLPLLADITAADVVTEIRPGVNGYLEHAEVVVTKAVTTAAKLATLNFEIDTTNCTGGTIALTSANMTPIGARVASAAFTANNRLYKGSKLSVEAASVTAFVEGSAYLLLRIRKI